MRVVFFALLLANLLYLGWAEWIDVPAPPPTSSIAGLPPLTLVRELPPDERAALARKMALQTAPAQCVSLGPFDDPAVAAKAAALLRTKSFAPQQRTTESPAIRRFWVYLDGFTSDAAEMRVLHKLERAGIDDAEAMPVAAGGRKVSLGLFSDRDRAERRARVVRTMGLKPAITARMLPGTVYWLDLTLASGAAPVPVKNVSDLEPGGSGSTIGVQPCPSAAQPTAPPPRKEPPAPTPVTSPQPLPRSTSPGSIPPSVPAVALPRCRPGGTVPCVAAPKSASQPSVL